MSIKPTYKRAFFIKTPFLILAFLLLSNCDSGSDGPGASEEDFTNLLTNQIDSIIIPTMEDYQTEMAEFETIVNDFVVTVNEVNLSAVRLAYSEAYLAYQAAALHNYYATANRNLVSTTNLFPIDLNLLENLIDSESYNFSTSAQERANGFPAIDYMLYGPENVVNYFNENTKRGAFFLALVQSIKNNADALVTSWSGSLRDNFIENGGTSIGSSISVQLNDILLYYEDHIRENKVGIPIGRLGPLDSPITPDPTKIEAYYQSLSDQNDEFALSLVRAAVQEMEDFYLGETSNGMDGQGYDDLLLAREQSSIDVDIKTQFEAIYQEIENRSSISGNSDLYDAVQGLVTLFKSDLLPVLNVQDSDGANDGD